MIKMSPVFEIPGDWDAKQKNFQSIRYIFHTILIISLALNVAFTVLFMYPNSLTVKIPCRSTAPSKLNQSTIPSDNHQRVAENSTLTECYPKTVCEALGKDLVAKKIDNLFESSYYFFEFTFGILKPEIPTIVEEVKKAWSWGPPENWLNLKSVDYTVFYDCYDRKNNYTRWGLECNDTVRTEGRKIIRILIENTLPLIRREWKNVFPQLGRPYLNVTVMRDQELKWFKADTGLIQKIPGHYLVTLHSNTSTEHAVWFPIQDSITELSFKCSN